MTELIGIVGAICFSICAVPEAYLAYHRGRTGLSQPFWWLWFTGEVCTIVYVSITNPDIILISNYTFNLLCLLVIGKYLFFPKESNTHGR